MAYRNKVYVAFDGDHDIDYYYLMKAWAINSYIAFDFNDAHEINYSHDWAKTESIKKQLHERLENSKIFIIFGDYPRIHVPFKEVMIRYAIDNWPLSVKNNNYKGAYHYRDYVYQMMGVW